ncbi:hypothetical protein O181_002064 [Austropuccinia psidii MF-1]|uniref:Uncharacterized protein n=1 Tax=Austropuccinia psidii MF-1 TaxID=1389203 RepID=A0A9Q3BBQ5_9BASI|nr:hypothetical protein [Austropuccinia psidii MF-1]
MKSKCKDKLPLSLAIPHKLSDNLTVGAQRNYPMISNELNVPTLSVIPNDVINDGTKPHHHNSLTDDISLNDTNPKSREQRKMLGYMNQTTGKLGIYTTKFFILTLGKKKDDNALWLKLPPQKLLPRPYVLINKHNKTYFPIIMYQINPLSSPTPVLHQVQKVDHHIKEACHQLYKYHQKH